MTSGPREGAPSHRSHERSSERTPKIFSIRERSGSTQLPYDEAWGPERTRAQERSPKGARNPNGTRILERSPKGARSTNGTRTQDRSSNGASEAGSDCVRPVRIEETIHHFGPAHPLAFYRQPIWVPLHWP